MGGDPENQAKLERQERERRQQELQRQIERNEAERRRIEAELARQLVERRGK